MHGTGGNEDESIGLGLPGCFDQLDGAHDVLLDEVTDATFAPLKASTWMRESGVDYGIAAGNEIVAAIWIAQVAFNPFRTGAMGSKPSRSLEGRYQQRSV